MKKQKGILKGLLAAVISMSLAVVMALGVAFSPAITVKAATVFIDTISAGETWHKSWSSLVESKTVRLDVDETALYTLTITDYKQTGVVDIYVVNSDGNYVFGHEGKQAQTETTDEFILSKDKQYDLVCYYTDVGDFYSNLDAEVSITLNKSAIDPITIPNCSLSNSSLAVEFEGKSEWLKFTPASSGDYSLNFQSGIYAWVYVYSTVTGECVYGSATTVYDYWSEFDIYRECLVYNLDANTTYFIELYSLENATSKISITKNTKAVQNIIPNSLVYKTIGCTWSSMDISYDCFNYKLVYTDNTTSDEIDYTQLIEKGYDWPQIEFLGGEVNVNGNTYLCAGKQFVASTYNDIRTVVSVNISSLVDAYSDLNATVPNEHYYVEYEDSEEKEYFRRIVVDETGIYAIYRYNDNTLNDNLYYSIEIVDEKNNVIEFDYSNGGWPLIAGRQYVMSFQYTYKPNCTSDIEWWLQKEICAIFPDTNLSNWYGDAVTYAVGRGIMSGYGNGNFGPADSIQRQDFLVILARFDGVDLSQYTGKSQFKDVQTGSYYAAAVNWGADKGIVIGYQNGCFGVSDVITREQLVTFLYRYASYKGIDVSYSNTTKAEAKGKYKDYSQVSDWSLDCVLWALENSVINGKNANTSSPTIAPQGNAQRCEVAQIMYNIFKNNVF